MIDCSNLIFEPILSSETLGLKVSWNELIKSQIRAKYHHIQVKAPTISKIIQNFQTPGQHSLELAKEVSLGPYLRSRLLFRLCAISPFFNFLLLIYFSGQKLHNNCSLFALDHVPAYITGEKIWGLWFESCDRQKKSPFVATFHAKLQMGMNILG